MRKTLILLVISAILLMAVGCSSNDDANDTSSSGDNSIPDNGIIMDIPDALSTTVATIGDNEIPANEFFYYFSDLAVAYEAEHNYAPLIDFGDTMLPDGTSTYIESATEYALDNAAKIIVSKKMFTDAQIELSDEDKSYVDMFISQTKADFVDENEFLMALASIGMTYEQYYENLELSLIEMKYIETVYGEGGEKEVSDADILELFNEQYIRVKYIYIPTIDITTQVALSDPEIEIAKTLTQELSAKVEAGEDLDSLITEYSKDPGMPADGYVINEQSSLTPEFLETAFTLDDNEYGISECPEGYYIIVRESLRDEDVDAMSQSQQAQGQISIKDELFSDIVYENYNLEVESYKNQNEIVKNEAAIQAVVDYYFEANSQTAS